MIDLKRKYNILHIDDLQNHYENNSKTPNWFSPDSMRFFKSQVSDKILASNERFYFVSSEKGPSGPRAYTIRSYNPKTFQIDSLSEFQGYRTNTQAWNGVERHLKSLGFES